MSNWIFLRGLTRESRHWGAFVDQFAQALPSHQVSAIDLPGNGLLNQQASPCRVPEMVAACRAQLAQLGVAPPYHLLAMSLGGMVAVAWAHAYPQEVAAQVLINTSMRPFNPFYQRLQPANYATLMQLAVSGASAHAWERAVLHMTSRVRDASVLPRWVALRQSHPVSRANALRQLLAAARFQAPSGAPLVPTLLLASLHDQLVSAQCSQRIAQHWHCPLRVHPAAGHDLPLDDGPWVAQQVCDWLVTEVP